VTTKRNQKGFGLVGVLAVVLAVGIIGAGGWLVYKNHNKKSVASDTSVSSQTSSKQTLSNSSQTQQTATQYLDIKEWGVKIPLSSQIADAYYVVPSGISNDADGKPSGVYLSTKSLNESCGDASAGNTNISIKDAVGGIVRVLPTDTDPVTGKLYMQLDPSGVTLGDYYYGYGSDISNKTCASTTLLQSIDSAFATAVKNAVSDTAQ
jgi:hypothetical protein